MPNDDRYCGFGLDFQSAIPLPEMREGQYSAGKAVTIRIADAPRPEGVGEVVPGVVVGPNDFWIDVPDVARFHVKGGTDILVQPADDATMNVIRSFLLGSAMGALLHQRGLLPLHASAVEMGGSAVIFSGTSGAGKSTMALHLVKRGHRLLCDDICAVDFSTGTPRLWPGLVNLKLWRTSLDSVGADPSALQQVLPTIDKYKLPVGEAADYRSIPVARFFLLEQHVGAAPSITAMAGAEAVAAFVSHTFRGQLVAPMEQSRRHFEQCVALRAAIAPSRLTRPWSLSRIADSCAAIEAELERGPTQDVV
jgi:hypothetical protein